MASFGEKFCYFLVGGFVGAGVALLFAPKSGEETRKFLETRYKEESERLGQKAREGKTYVTERSREAADRFSRTLEKGKEVFEREREQLSAAMEAGKTAYQKERGKLGEIVTPPEENLPS